MSQPKVTDTMLKLAPDTELGVREWADRFWDTYGFDYDTERCANGALWVWPYGIELEQLKTNLREDGIEFSEHEIDLNEFFGLINDAKGG